LEPGTIINEKYQVIALLGSGGMGHVYRVQQISLGKEFALKVLDARSLSDVTVRRFHQEARTTSQLQHPNLVEVHDFGVLNETQPYLVMDLIEGESLSETLKREGALPVEHVIPLAIQVSFGLMYAHKKGVVHRDVKPGNIMLLQPEKPAVEGAVKVVDFGIAKLTQSEDGEIQALTKTGEIFGSPIYMSPEQCKGTGVDKRSDIYSFGCVLFECLTGSPPFFGDSAMSTMMKRLSEEPVSLKEGSLGREFPPALENIIRKMLAAEPNDRYQDFSGVVQDLMTLQTTGGAIEVRPAVAESAKKPVSLRPQIKTIVGVAMVCALATFIFDVFILFPEQVQAEFTAKKVSEAKAALEAKLKDEQLMSSRSKEEELDEEALGLDRESRKTFGRMQGVWSGVEPLTVDKNYPYVDVVDTESGQKKYLVFPKNVGEFCFDGGSKLLPAFGRYEMKPNAGLILLFDKASGANPNILKNIIHLKFAKIDYQKSLLATENSIALLEKVRDVFAVGLRGIDISSLSSLYKNSTLQRLEVMDTDVSPEELFKLRSFGQLECLTFGPVFHPELVLEALSKSNKITTLAYRGQDTTKEKRSPDDIQRELSALTKLTKLTGLALIDCAYFDDACLQKLTSLPNLAAIQIRDCALTEKSIEIFKKFKKLRSLAISVEKWTPSSVARLKSVKEWHVQTPLTRNERMGIPADIVQKEGFVKSEPGQ
jgi:serine/threonine protein kinase